MREITEKTKLFENGKPSVYGWAQSGIIEYNVEDAKLRPFKLKEWDFYQIANPEFSMQITLGHLTYVTSIDVTIIEFMSGKRTTIGKTLLGKKITLDSSAEEDSKVTYKDKDLEITFKTTKNFRQIKAVGVDKKLGKIDIDITLLQNPLKILVCTPFERDDEFYLNEKFNCMTACGYARIGNLTYNVDDKKDMAVLDWGRGVLPKKHEWIWGSMNERFNGKPFGFNLGIFGSDEFATENILYYGDKKQKLGKVKIDVDKTDFMKPWHFYDDEGMIDIYMAPTFDNFTDMNFVIIHKTCHQVYGNWRGTVVIDGEKLEIADLFAFAEVCNNNW